MVLPGSLQVGITPENSHFLGLQGGFSQTAPSLRNPDSRGMKHFGHLDWIKQLVSVQREIQGKTQIYFQH